MCIRRCKRKERDYLKYLKEVTEIVQFTDDHGALDLTLANVIPVATALKSQALNQRYLVFLQLISFLLLKKMRGN